SLTHVAGMDIGWSYRLCMLAAAYRDIGRFDDALDSLTKSLTTAHEQEELYYEAEIHRLRGDVLQMQDVSNAMEAHKCYERALEIARKQDGKSLELRATMSLARLFSKQGRRDEARTMLADIYRWFTEGFDTADLKDAKALLDDLGN